MHLLRQIDARLPTPRASSRPGDRLHLLQGRMERQKTVVAVVAAQVVAVVVVEVEAASFDHR